MLRQSTDSLLLLLLLGVVIACSKQVVPGPDQQFVGSFQGALSGAGAGAVTGVQVGAGAGPGVAVGAGLGAISGAIQGYSKDNFEEQLIGLAEETRSQREVAYAHALLAEHYQRRKALHPSRDIFPADWFFFGDEAKIKPEAKALLREIAIVNKQHLAWSRLAIAAYVKALDKDSTYAAHLARQRSQALCNQLVEFGIEPRRLEARPIVIDAPLLIDPYDRRDKYSQAIEIIAVDR